MFWRAGAIDLNGINTYTGGTVISSNVLLTLSGTGVLDPNGSVVINSSTLDISAITSPSQTIRTLSGSTGEIILGTHITHGQSFHAKFLILERPFDWLSKLICI